MKNKRLWIGVISALFVLVITSVGFWVYSNTSLLTTKVPQDELNANNLNLQSAEYGLVPIDIQGNIINIPQGFSLDVFAEDLGSARFMTFSPTDALFVGTKDNDKIYAVKDTNKDGKADYEKIIESGLNSPHSVYYYDGDLYLGEENQVSVYRGIKDDGTYTKKEVLIADLPAGNRLTGGGHKTRTVVIGPDEKLYVSIGSTCNVCEEDDNRRATIMKYDLDGSNGEIFANGLRNTVGFDFDEQGNLWGADMGRDQIGDDTPPEEVNIIEPGKNYGWPYCYGNQIANPEYSDRTDYCQSQTEKPYFNMQAHSAPLGFMFLSNESKANWPEQYKQGFLVAFHGSWNRTVPTGYKVVWIDTSDEQPKQFNFLSGWLENSAESWGRPVGLVFDSNGNLYVSDDKQGLIYKLSIND